VNEKDIIGVFQRLYLDDDNDKNIETKDKKKD